MQYLIKSIQTWLERDKMPAMKFQWDTAGGWVSLWFGSILFRMEWQSFVSGKCRLLVFLNFGRNKRASERHATQNYEDMWQVRKLDITRPLSFALCLYFAHSVIFWKSEPTHILWKWGFFSHSIPRSYHSKNKELFCSLLVFKRMSLLNKFLVQSKTTSCTLNEMTMEQTNWYQVGPSRS